MTPDRNFVIDSLASKGMPQIVVCCGAGHAYKYVTNKQKSICVVIFNYKNKTFIKKYALIFRETDKYLKLYFIILNMDISKCDVLHQLRY